MNHARSNWEHPICPGCWATSKREFGPVLVAPHGLQTCCICLSATGAGMHVRRSPDDMPCGALRELRGGRP